MTYEPHRCIEEFGVALINARDLDPIYEMLYQSKLSGDRLYRWLVAYWFFYHAGTASWITEKEGFYDAVLYAFDNNLPRGSERRHFRGDSARFAILQIAGQYPSPEWLVSSLTDAGDAPMLTFGDIQRRVLKLPHFGVWMAFKVADMLERVCGLNIDFSDCEMHLYDSPAQAARFIYESERIPEKILENGVFVRKGWKPSNARRDDVARASIAWLVYYFQNVKAPPRYDRSVNVQEAETILCKYKSHRNGSYAIGKDLREVYHSLSGYGRLAEELREGIDLWVTVER